MIAAFWELHRWFAKHNFRNLKMRVLLVFENRGEMYHVEAAMVRDLEPMMYMHTKPMNARSGEICGIKYELVTTDPRNTVIYRPEHLG